MSVLAMPSVGWMHRSPTQAVVKGSHFHKDSLILKTFHKMAPVCNLSFQSSPANILLVGREPCAQYLADPGAMAELQNCASVSPRNLLVQMTLICTQNSQKAVDKAHDQVLNSGANLMILHEFRVIDQCGWLSWRGRQAWR